MLGSSTRTPSPPQCAPGPAPRRSSPVGGAWATSSGPTTRSIASWMGLRGVASTRSSPTARESCGMRCSAKGLLRIDPRHPERSRTPATAHRRSSRSDQTELVAARKSRLDVFVGVIRRPHQRTGGDVLEPERQRCGLEGGELLRLPVPHDRQVALGGPQVLPDGEDLDALLAQVAERIYHLLVGLAEAHHQAGLGRLPRRRPSPWRSAARAASAPSASRGGRPGIAAARPRRCG